MPKASSPAGYFAVRSGRVPGIYHSWAECEAQIKGFQGGFFRKFNSDAEAKAFMAAKPSAARTSVAPDTTRSSPEIDCDIVYCDGACKGNGQPGSIAGIGVWWGHGDPRNISERCPGDQTNNRAELIAIARILETAPHLKRRLVIKTDSKYAIQCLTVWIFKWMRNGFLAGDGKPVKNRALITYVVALLHVRRKTSQKIEFQHVRGHVGIEGNEAADQLANHGATKPAVPERDWESLEKQALQRFKPVTPISVAVNDLKAYAGALLDNDHLERNVTLPEQNRLRSKNNDLRSHSSLAQVSPPLAKATVPRDANTTPVNKEDLEVYASCLLGDDELSALGQDGVFDSDV